MVECYTCQLLSQRDKGASPLWDNIYRTDYWDVVHSHPQHPHVHFHIVPRMPDQPEERRSARIMEYLGVPENKRVDEATMNRIGERIRQHL